jgi:aminoglycoside phosphotransferase
MKENLTKHIKEVVKPVLPKSIENVLHNSTFLKLIRNYPEPSFVYRIITQSNATLFMKVGKGLSPELEKLEWLKEKINVPNVIDFSTLNDTDYLLMTEVNGIPCDEPNWRQKPKFLIDKLIQAIQILQSIDFTNCSFHYYWKEQIEEAKIKIDKGTLRTNNLSKKYQYQSIEKHYERLVSLIPENDAITFTHGDLCLPNILISNDKISFVDLGLSGVSDEYRDLALLSRSICSNYGDELELYFLKKYCNEIDYNKIEFYRLLDQFVMHRNY